MGRNLIDLHISESFNYLMQVSGSNVQNGLGASLSGSVLDLRVVSASYAVSASHEIIKEVSSSYADFAQTAESASHAENADNAGIATFAASATSASFAVTSSLPLQGFVNATVQVGSITLIKGDGTETIIPISVTGSISSSISSSYAATADEMKVVSDNTNNTRYIGFVDLTSGRDNLRADTSFSYNPSTNIVTAGTFNGALSGNATTATSASRATSAATADLATTATSASYVLGSNVDGAVANATDAVYAQNTIITGKNLEATEIAKGTPLYFTGSGTSGNLVGILRADAGNPARMPAGGIAGEAIASGAEGVVLLDGFINGVNTSAFASGDEVFVGVGGGYTNVAPTGSNNLIQHLGNVEKSAVNGSGVIQMMGEPRGLPNIAQNNVWLGNANGVPQAVNQNTLSVKQAVSSSRSYVNVSAANVDYHVTFNTITAGYKELLQETEGSQFTYNPSNNKLTVANISATTLSGSLFGNATTATTASHVTEAVVAKTDKNNSFTGTQTFNNINVNGTGSFAYISAVTGSAKIIGDAYIILNNDTPTQRYAGIVVQDSGSGSPLTTASLEFDGQTNDWFYEYSNDGGVTTDHGVALFGPAYSSKGSPTYLTANSIPKSSGSHHLADSNISDNGSVVEINSNSQITGSLSVTGNIVGNDETYIRRALFDTNPFNGSKGNQLGAIRLGDTNNYFYQTLYDTAYGFTSQSLVELRMDTGSGLFSTKISAKSGNTEAKVQVFNDNGSRNILLDSDLNIISGSVVLDDTLTVKNNVTITGSLLHLGNTTHNGNTTQNGYTEQNFAAPGINQEKAFFNVSGAQVNSKNYNRVFYGMADYSGFGLQFEDYFAIEYYDGFGYNYGSEFDINGKQVQLYTKASGSGQESYVRTTDNYNGTSQVSIGSGNKVVLNGKTEITGSTEIRLTGAESLKAFKPGSGTFSTTGGDITATFGSTQVAVATPYGGTLGVKNTSTGDDFGLAADMSQWGFLGDWTGPGIFANDPSDNYPTIIGFQNKSSWTDGRVTVLTPMHVTSSNGFPLYVDGTMNTRRIHFDKNPFNNLQNGALGAIRLDSNNTSFYSTLYNDTYNQTSQSMFIAELDTTSSFTATRMEADYGGTIGSFEVRNDNGVRSATLLSDTYHVTGSASFQSTITGSISTAYNNNTSSGSIGFWQGSQAEYNLISGSASNSIIYFVV